MDIHVVIYNPLNTEIKYVENVAVVCKKSK